MSQSTNPLPDGRSSDGRGSIHGARSRPPLHPDDAPLAYLITFTTYGTWLHGDERGSVDRDHNLPGTAVLATDRGREVAERQLMNEPPYAMDAPRRDAVLAAIREVSKHRRWPLLAAHIRTTHVHVVVQAFFDGDKVMNDFKAYSSRKLNEAGFDSRGRKRWTRHGSTRKLWTETALEAAIRYVVHDQGEPMAVFEDLSAIVRLNAELEQAATIREERERRP